MGRRPSNPDAVPRLRARKRRGKCWYYYDHGGKPRREEPLGCDYALALKRWAEIEGEPESPKVMTFRTIVEAYFKEVVPTKAERTQKDNRKEAANLLAFFDDPPAPLESIEPVHVRQYLRWRSGAKVRANREKALLSHVWNWARDQGYTALPNPCAGIKGNREDGRDVYIEDDEYLAIMAHGDEVLRDAMAVAYLTGQRPADVLKMTVADIRDGVIRVRQNKTGAVEQIEIIGELAVVIDRIKARKALHKVYSTRLIVNAQGRPIGVHALSVRFRAAADAAGLPRVQFRDLRAKAGTDKLVAAGDITQAQRLLGHSNVRTTEIYIRRRRGHTVKPTRL